MTSESGKSTSKKVLRGRLRRPVYALVALALHWPASVLAQEDAGEGCAWGVVAQHAPAELAALLRQIVEFRHAQSLIAQEFPVRDPKLQHCMRYYFCVFFDSKGPSNARTLAYRAGFKSDSERLEIERHADELEAMLHVAVSRDGTAHYNPSAHAFRVKDHPANLKDLETVFRRLDAPSAAPAVSTARIEQ